VNVNYKTEIKTEKVISLLRGHKQEEEEKEMVMVVKMANWIRGRSKPRSVIWAGLVVRRSVWAIVVSFSRICVLRINTKIFNSN
jgi:hypothetical protein